eukprot:TRINITY_DN80661_c0_g1_i1.p1 TRINITY_DN80661_c0_g1~~TRINITY_DN80661_c0_g1_i1.p1  ORF type:complete len:208 (-),score=46.36 TRINITY_DN80661_c0_g1_i1:136-711(-)
MLSPHAPLVQPLALPSKHLAPVGRRHEALYLAGGRSQGTRLCVAAALVGTGMALRARGRLHAQRVPEPRGAAAEGEMAGGSFELMKTSGVEFDISFKAADDFARRNKLRKLGDSQTAAKKWAAYYPQDEAFTGLVDWLKCRGCKQHYHKVNAWCKEMGAESIIDLIENTEDIAELLGDSLSKEQRLALLRP